MLFKETVNSFNIWKWNENDMGAKRIIDPCESDFKSVLRGKRSKEKSQQTERPKKNDFESVLKEKWI